MVWILRKKKGKSSMPYRGKSTAKQYMVRRTGKHSKGEREGKGCQENIQNPKRSVARYWDRESRYT